VFLPPTVKVDDALRFAVTLATEGAHAPCEELDQVPGPCARSVLRDEYGAPHRRRMRVRFTHYGGLVGRSRHLP
jgi:hypothetical protein